MSIFPAIFAIDLPTAVWYSVRRRQVSVPGGRFRKSAGRIKTPRHAAKAASGRRKDARFRTERSSAAQGVQLAGDGAHLPGDGCGARSGQRRPSDGRRTGAVRGKSRARRLRAQSVRRSAVRRRTRFQLGQRPSVPAAWQRQRAAVRTLFRRARRARHGDGGGRRHVFLYAGDGARTDGAARVHVRRRGGDGVRKDARLSRRAAVRFPRAA